MHRYPRSFMTESCLCSWLAACMVIVGCGRDKEATAPPAAATAAAPAKNLVLKIAFAYGGPVTDVGWTFAHDRGRKALEEQFGGKVGTSFVESGPEPADAEGVIRELVTKGNTLIFGTSQNHAEAIVKVAASTPGVKFEQVAAGDRTGNNLRTYDARSYEGAYMAGVIAGSMTKSKLLGVVGSIPMPEVIRNINSFTLGAQSSKPDVKVRVAWVNGWFDPPKEAGEAQTLIDQGADVLFHNTYSAAVVQTAETAGKLALGWGSNMGKAGAHAHVGSVVVNWEPYYEKTVKELLDGSWKPASTWWGVKEGAVDLVSMENQVPPAVVAKVEAIKAGLKDGSFHPWTGPILDQAGKQLLQPGERASDEFLRALHVYVRGVEATQ